MPSAGRPRISALDDAELGRARIVALHAPQDAPDGTTAWTLSLVDVQGVAIASQRVAVPDRPVPLDEVVRHHLDVVGLATDGGWQTGTGHDGLPRHLTLVSARCRLRARR